MKRLIASLCLAVLAGCASLGGITTPPQVSLSNVDVREIGLFEQRLGLQLRVQNPNAASLDIRGLSYTVDVNGRQFARGVSDSSVSVPRYGEALLDVPATTNIAGLLRQIDEWRKSGSKQALTYKLSGTLYPSWGPGIPFTHEGEVPLPAMPGR